MKKINLFSLFVFFIFFIGCIDLREQMQWNPISSQRQTNIQQKTIDNNEVLNTDLFCPEIENLIIYDEVLTSFSVFKTLEIFLKINESECTNTEYKILINETINNITYGQIAFSNSYFEDHRIVPSLFFIKNQSEKIEIIQDFDDLGIFKISPTNIIAFELLINSSLIDVKKHGLEICKKQCEKTYDFGIYKDIMFFTDSNEAGQRIANIICSCHMLKEEYHEK